MTDLEFNFLCQYLEDNLAFYLEQDDPYSLGSASFIRTLLSRIYSGYYFKLC